MPQAENIVSFPIPAQSTDFLCEAIGGPSAKLGSVADRLDGLRALVSLAKNDPDLPAFAAMALGGIEQQIDDCLSLIGLEPLR